MNSDNDSAGDGFRRRGVLKIGGTAVSLAALGVTGSVAADPANQANTRDQKAKADAVLESDVSEGVREEDNWITAYVSAKRTTEVLVELDGEVYGNGDDEWPNNEDVYFFEINVDVDTDGIEEDQSDDFRFGYAAADSDVRKAAIDNSETASGDGGYIRRNTGTESPNRTDIAAEDVDGFDVTESDDRLSYSFEIDWAVLAGDEDVPGLPEVPNEIKVNEVFGGDGGEGVATGENNSFNDGRGNVDNVSDASDVLRVKGGRGKGQGPKK